MSDPIDDLTETQRNTLKYCVNLLSEHFQNVYIFVEADSQDGKSSHHVEMDHFQSCASKIGCLSIMRAMAKARIRSSTEVERCDDGDAMR